MADIVHIRDRLEQNRSRAPRPFQPAQVLFFTGVRYERIELMAPNTPIDENQPLSAH